MTQLELKLWMDEEIQEYLRQVISEHSRRLLEMKTPRADALQAEFARRIKPLLDKDTIDGRAVYEILIDTGGADYANDLYGRYKTEIHDSGNSQLPPLRDVADELENLPPLDPEMIGGILRRGQRMLIAGGSKTSKSFLALELAVSVALGREWLNTYPCEQGRALYINGEIDRASFALRISAILDRMRIGPEELREKLTILNLRDVEITISQLFELISRNGGFDLVIIDPIYTLGDVNDENNAAEVRRFLKEIGRLSNETGAAVVCIHHHAKGQQGGKKAIDRASGSGVFGRWFDAVADLTTLHIPDGVGEQSRTPESVPMRLEYDVRNFKQPKPLSVWWHYPIHIPDTSGELAGLLVDGDPRGNLAQYQSGQSEEQRQAQRDADMSRAIAAITADGREPTVKAVADELGVSDRSVRGWLDKSSTIIRNGRILKTENRK